MKSEAFSYVSSPVSFLTVDPQNTTIPATTVCLQGSEADNAAIAVSASQVKTLGGMEAGKIHHALSFGAQTFASIKARKWEDSDPKKKQVTSKAEQKKHKLRLTIAENVLQAIRGFEKYFLVGLLQRGGTNKVMTSSKSAVEYEVLLSVNQFSKETVEQAKLLSASMFVTRTLINLPPNVIHPTGYESFVKSLLSDASWKKAVKNIDCKILQEPELKRLGCNLIRAVGNGSKYPPRIIRLSYAPTKKQKNTKHVVLVGKGITFDTGGLDIKGSSVMRNMKKDMGGSASVLGTFFHLAGLQPNLQLTCYLALAENAVSADSMRPGDVYTSREGITVEIDNTDAEGRLVLADAMSLAKLEKPDLMIDVATLTGAARVALGPQVDALMSNVPAHADALVKLSAETGDWVWPLPLVDSYNSMLDSNIADCMNSSTTGHGGAITAGLFLQKFAGTCKWIHLDSYMWTDKSNELYAEAGATAKCVVLLSEFILRQAS